MRSLYRTLSLRFLQQRWSRALLIVASIALGVATLVATRSLNDSVWAAARASATPLAGLADLNVGNGDSGVSRDLVSVLAAQPDVRAAEPVVLGRVRLPDIGGHANVPLLGMDYREADTAGSPWGVRIDWTVPIDRLPAGKTGEFGLRALRALGIRPVLVGEGLARELKEVPVSVAMTAVLHLLGKDWSVKLATAQIHLQAVGGDAQSFFRIGTVHADGPAGEFIKNLVITDTADAAELLHLPPSLVTRIDVFLKPGVAPKEAAARLNAVVAGRALVHTSEAADERLEDILAGMQLGFSLSGAGALVVGLFMVYNALAVSVAERRQDIGILRSVGATRWQICALFLGEAGLLGLAGAALGVPVGVGLARIGLGPIEQVLSDLVVPIDSRALKVTIETVLTAGAAGLGTALVAALVPALAAAREQPASAVRRIPPIVGVRHRFAHVGGTAALLAFGILGMFLHDWLPGRIGTYGGFVVAMLGMLLATPLLAALLATLLQPLARKFAGVGGRLAADNLIRAPGRTGLVIAAVAAGVTMFVQTAGVIRSNKDPIFDWLDRTLTGDLLVTSGSAIPGSGESLLLPGHLDRDCEKKIPGVRAAVALRSRNVDFHGHMIFLLAIDAARLHQADPHGGPLADPDRYAALSASARNGAFVSENFAAQYHVGIGDTIALHGPRGPVSFHVLGTVEDYNWNRGSVIIDRTAYVRDFDDPLVDELFVYLQPGAAAQSVSDAMLKKYEANDALLILSRTELLGHLEEQIRRFSAVAYSQEVVVGLVAALGVVTALLISVLQRRRELGILRAIGATRLQVVWSVLVEATLMGIVGTVIGVGLGVLVEWYVMKVIIFTEGGFLMSVRPPWVEAAVIAASAVTIATLAGLGPALRTLRLRIPEAISYE